jgi:SWI/SNF-related matrix-associated actin-dependent regulator 1 of chromatin subfamily A
MQDVKTVKKATSVFDKKGTPLVKIAFPFDIDTIEKVRTLGGRKYHPDIKCWSAPIFLDTLKKLKEWGFELDEKLSEMISQAEEVTERIETQGVEILGLKKELFPFQKKGIAFVENKGGRALIADEMGLGKTIQALGWIQLHPEKRPVIIVVPASMKLKWRQEVIDWLPNPKVEVLSGSTPYKIRANIVIINYDILHSWVGALQNLNAQVLITDECHYYKSNKAKRTKAVKMLSKGIPHVIAMSGTPIVNRPVEAYNAIKMISPMLFPKEWDFLQRYCGARYDGYGWNFTGANHTKELHNILINSIMIRRLKSEVLTDLPPKVYSYVPLSLDNEAEYAFAKNNFIQFVKQTRGVEAARKASNAEVIASIIALRQVAVKGKLNQVINWVQDYIDSDTKLVLFAIHKFAVDAIMQAFGDAAVKIDGSVSMEQRHKVVNEFQSNPNVKLFVGNIQAAGVGLTLTAASNVAFMELPWTPGELVQAEDRCHRIGQKDSVTVHYLLAADTIEYDIAELLDAKKKVLDAVLDGRDTPDESLLTELMKRYSS